MRSLLDPPSEAWTLRPQYNLLPRLKIRGNRLGKTRFLKYVTVTVRYFRLRYLLLSRIQRSEIFLFQSSPKHVWLLLLCINRSLFHHTSHQQRYFITRCHQQRKRPVTVQRKSRKPTKWRGRMTHHRHHFLLVCSVCRSEDVATAIMDWLWMRWEWPVYLLFRSGCKDITMLLIKSGIWRSLSRLHRHSRKRTQCGDRPNQLIGWCPIFWWLPRSNTSMEISTWLGSTPLMLTSSISTRRLYWTKQSPRLIGMKLCASIMATSPPSLPSWGSVSPVLVWIKRSRRERNLRRQCWLDQSLWRTSKLGETEDAVAERWENIMCAIQRRARKIVSI